jgi:hypothetical protein
VLTKRLTGTVFDLARDMLSLYEKKERKRKKIKQINKMHAALTLLECEPILHFKQLYI